MSATSTSQTLTERVFLDLRGDIINGRLPAGSALKLSPLAKRFDVSMSVIRESLVRLSEQGLAQLSPNQGFKVVSITADDLIDLTDLRIRLEGLALAESIRHGDTAWEATIVAAHHVLERTAMTHDGLSGASDDWSHAHAEFHDALGAGCGRPRLISLTRSMRDSSEVYRQLSSTREASGKRDVAAEHRELMNLATARREGEAVEALRNHLQRTTDIVLTGLGHGN
jgi:DNA-binding GntR family transcriptional regulator